MEDNLINKKSTAFVLLWEYNFTYETRFFSGIVEIFANLNYFFIRIILLGIIYGLIISIVNVYGLLLSEKIGFTGGIKIFPHEFLFNILYMILFSDQNIGYLLFQ